MTINPPTREARALGERKAQVASLLRQGHRRCRPEALSRLNGKGVGLELEIFCAPPPEVSLFKQQPASRKIQLVKRFIV